MRTMGKMGRGIHLLSAKGPGPEGMPGGMER